MSNRTLVEINHDLTHRMKDDPVGFVADLRAYLGAASPRTARALERYGIRVIGMKHHSDPHTIKWGGVEEGAVGIAEKHGKLLP